MPSWFQKFERRTFPADFCNRNFWGGVSRYAATPLIVALSPDHSDIIRFRPWSPIATGNHLDRAEKIPKVAQMNGTVDVLIRLQAFRDTLRGELSHIQIFMNDGPNPLTWDAQLLSYLFSWNPPTSRISSWIWSIISGVVTAMGRPGRSTLQVEKSPLLKCTTQFLTVASYGACFPNVSVRMAWMSLGALRCREKKLLDNNSRLDVVEIARVVWHASSQTL